MDRSPSRGSVKDNVQHNIKKRASIFAISLKPKPNAQYHDLLESVMYNPKRRQTAFRHTNMNEDEYSDEYGRRKSARSSSFVNPGFSLASDDLKRLNILAQNAIDEGNSESETQSVENFNCSIFLFYFWFIFSKINVFCFVVLNS